DRDPRDQLRQAGQLVPFVVGVRVRAPQAVAQRSAVARGVVAVGQHDVGHVGRAAVVHGLKPVGVIVGIGIAAVGVADARHTAGGVAGGGEHVERSAAAGVHPGLGRGAIVGVVGIIGLAVLAVDLRRQVPHEVVGVLGDIVQGVGFR